MLSIALHSLLTFGSSGADIVILTNESGHDRVTRLLKPFRAQGTRFMIKLVPADTLIDFTSARYRIAEFADLQSYGPVLYLDTDIVIDAEIGGLLTKIAQSTGISACPEGRILHKRDYWGRSLFLKDASVKVAKNTEGFSSGILGAASIEELRTPFKRILDQIEKWRADGNPPFAVYDQPHAIYTLVKYGHYNGEILRFYVRIVGNKFDVDPEVRLGIAHFAGGVGRNDPKLQRMRAYLGALTT